MNALLKAFKSKKYCCYDPNVAGKIGSINASIFLHELVQRFAYHEAKRSLIKLRNQEGFWFYFTQEKCQERTKLSRKEQESAIEKLEKQGLIKKIQAGIPCKRHFQLNEEKILQFLEGQKSQQVSKKSNKTGQKQQTRLTEKSNCKAQKEQTTKETKEEQKKITTISHKINRSSFSFLNRHLQQLDALNLDSSQKHTLYCTFDDQSILNAIDYYTSLKKEPNNLGGFLYTACQRQWKKSANQDKKVIVNKNLAFQTFGKHEGTSLKGVHIAIYKNEVLFTSGYTIHCLKYEEKDFAIRLNQWVEKLEPY